jgi:hypothetical protein
MPKHLKGGGIKINKGFYEGGGRKYASQDIRWLLHETMG